LRDWEKIEGITKATTDNFLIGILIDNQCGFVVAIILYIVDVTRKKKSHPRSFKNRKKQQQQAIKQKRTYSRLTSSSSSSLSKSLLCINDDIESKLQA
jgi:hypothetical protein